jgi:hypothetical protein
MVVARPTPDHEAWTEKTDCPACDAREIKHTASLLASAIAEHMKTKRSAPAPAEEATPTPLTVTPPPAPPPALDSRPLPAPPKPSASVPTYLSLTALAGGAALIGAGIYLIHLDGEGTCDTAAPQELCARRYRTRNAGIGLVTGGGLAALGGLVGLIFFSPSSGATPVALGFTGSSISVSGGF